MKIKVLLLICVLIPSITASSMHASNTIRSNVNQVTTATKEQPMFSVQTQKLETDQGEPLVFKLLNFNIQVGLHPEWKDVLKEQSPDIAFLDETSFWKNSQDENFLAVLDELNAYFVNEDPYEGAVIDEVGDNAGSTIISRFPIVSSHQFLNYQADDGSVKDFQRNFLDVTIDIDGTQAHVVGGHFKCCEDGLEKRTKSMEEIINYLDDLGNVPIIFTGDFNSDSPQDVGLVAAVFSSLGDEPLEMLLNNTHPKGSKVHNWIDAYRELNPRNPGYTYEDTIFNSRIDYAFVNDFFHDKLVNASVIKTPSALAVWGGNDHFPIEVAFNMNPELADLRPPFRPYNLTGTVVSDTEISFTWPANDEADFAEYNVYRDDVLVQQTTNTFYSDNTLTSGVIYKYEVTSEDNSTNESFRSDPLYINTAYGILTVPSAPIVTATAGPAQASLSWTVEDDGGFAVDYYKVFRATESSIADNYFIFQTKTTETSWVDDRAWSGKTWYYYVIAINKIGTSNQSLVVDVSPTEVVTTTEPSESSKNNDSPFISSPMYAALLLSAVIIPIRRKKYAR